MSDFSISRGTQGGLWRHTGFALRSRGDGQGNSVVEFCDLNPEQQFQQVFSRAAMFRIGVWFLRRAMFGDPTQ